MHLALLGKALRYLVVNPRYFFLYFLGRPERALAVAVGEDARHRFAEWRAQLAADREFLEAVRDRVRTTTGEPFDLDADHSFLYALIRALKPARMLETGVFDGAYTAVFLKGLADNAAEDGREGRLVSIDLPARAGMKDSTSNMRRVALPPGCDPGWLIPDALRTRWKLLLGDSRELLAPALAELGSVDCFFHDSLHTFEHMTFEYRTAWPFLREGGVLLSHDVHWNRAFPRFVRAERSRDTGFHGFGVARKPAARTS